MRITWRKRLEQQPALRTYTNWPVIPFDSLRVEKQKDFLRNQQIVAQVLDNSEIKSVAIEHNLTPGRVSQLLDRCLGGDDEQFPALTKGLVPFRNLAERQRKQAPASLERPFGDACAFKALLRDAPGLFKALDELLKPSIGDKPNAQRPTPQAFHGEFKRVLTENHWPRDCYPYTNKSLAYPAVRRYLYQRWKELDSEQQQKKVQSKNRDLGVRRKIYRALRAIQIDEHELDLEDRVHLVLNDELIPLRLGRGQVLAAIDVDTNCILGFHAVPTKAPNQQDLLELFDVCVKPWEPLELATPGLSYQPGACFPSGLPNAHPISFGYVHLDNAWLHRAHSVRDLLAVHMGATIAKGLPFMPKVRQLIESVFDYINEHFSHRVDSTTGSHPNDPIRESKKNRNRPPLTTWQTVLEALSIILTDWNVTPHAELGGASPLELFQHHCSEHFIPYTPSVLAQQWQPFIGSKVVKLHWYRQEKRAPLINFAYARYQGLGLYRVVGKVKHIRIVFNRRDVRSVHAYTLDGEDLGILNAPLSWQRFPHSLALRIKLHKEIKAGRLSARDPLAEHFRQLLEHKDQPSYALSLMQVYTEFTGAQGGTLSIGDTGPQGESNPESVSPYVWTTHMANHRS